jgi:3-methyl-2-oxobutanoate hydroxymethyltransferase
MLGLTKTPPKFVKKYANLDEIISRAVLDYANEVKNRQFPQPEHCFLRG